MRHEKSPHRFATHHARQHARPGSARDHRRHPPPTRQVRRRYLRCHSAHAALARRGRDVPVDRRADLHPIDHRAGVAALVHTIDRAENHQQPRRREIRHQRREVIVVADLRLVGGQRIVLVDDRDDAAGQQLVDGVPCADEPPPILDVLVHQQQLGDADPRSPERLREGGHQLVLTDRRRRLTLHDTRRRGIQPQIRKPRGHRAGHHHDNLMPAMSEHGDVVDEIGDHLGTQPPPPGDHRATHLHHDTLRLADAIGTRQCGLRFEYHRHNRP